MTERLKIDETDAKILRQLLKESRTSFTDLSKLCGITVGAVRMRYKKLWRIGVINGEIMQVNPQSLGYKCICDIGIKTSIENEKSVIAFLESKPYIQLVLRVYGKYNLTTKVALSDMQELAAILEDVESNEQIKEVDAMIWADIANTDHPENIVIAGSASEKKPAANMQHGSATRMPFEMDDLDRKIAKILSQHSRTTFRKIAEQTGISTKNVIQRYRRLRGNVLTLSTISVNLKKLGYNAHAFILIKVANKSKLQEVYSRLVVMPNVINLTRLIGRYDLAVILSVQEFQDLFKFKEELRKMVFIEDTDIQLGPPMPMYPLNMFPALL